MLTSRISVLFVVVLFCCKPASTANITGVEDMHNSENSLDWDGVYRGVLPCDDCEGIQTTVTLSKTHDYKTKTRHLGKSDSEFEYSGKFSWNDAGNTITLHDPGKNNPPIQYLVGENTLTQLDMNGNKVTGESAEKYILSKEQYAILEKYWKLTELYGKPVEVDSTFNKEPHIILKEKDNRIIGNGGCNSIFGMYELNAGNRITFSKMGSTQLACANMELEREFLRVLQMADNYNLVADTLVLNKARMAPLARFRMVYMK